MDIFKKVFTTEGRLNRRMHLKYQMIWTTLVGLSVLTCQLLFGFLTAVAGTAGANKYGEEPSDDED